MNCTIIVFRLIQINCHRNTLFLGFSLTDTNNQNKKDEVWADRRHVIAVAIIVLIPLLIWSDCLLPKLQSIKRKPNEIFAPKNVKWTHVHL